MIAVKEAHLLDLPFKYNDYGCDTSIASVLAGTFSTHSATAFSQSPKIKYEEECLALDTQLDMSMSYYKMKYKQPKSCCAVRIVVVLVYFPSHVRRLSESCEHI